MNSPDALLFTSQDDSCYNHLEYVIRHLIRNDFSILKKEKQIFFYDHPDLKKISPYIIKTDSVIFINSDYFNSLSNCETFKENKDFIEQLHKTYIQDEFEPKQIRKIIPQLEMVQLIKNIFNDNINHNTKMEKFSIKNPIFKMSDESFLSLLKDLNFQKPYQFLKTELENRNNPEHTSYFTLPEKHKKYLTNFKTKTFPAFIHNYNKICNLEGKENANEFAEYFSSYIANEIGVLNNIGFSNICSQFSQESIETEYNLNIKFSEHLKMIATFKNANHFNEHKRTILIQELCDSSDFDFLNELKKYNKKYQHKKKM